MSDTHRSEYEKQLAGEEFWNSDPEISAKKSYARDLCDQYNLTRESEPERRLELLQTLFGNCDDKIFIKPPFHCDFGYNIHVGKNFFANFDVVSLPEFLREGFAVHDFFNPDRIVVGANTEKARNVIRELYKPFEGKTNMLFVKRRSSETIKYASNAFLAIKIHYINEMANFCEKTGADITEVAKGMGLDSRIGNRFLNPGPGYGGSCFPKDTMAMAYMARQNDVDMTLIKAAIEGNTKRKKEMAERILDAVKDIEKPKIAVLGLAFKDGTDDCRESPAMEIVGNLLEQNADVTAYDPKAMGTACQLVGDKIQYADDMYSCLKGADVLAVLTEWNEFKTLDLNLAASLMRHKNIIDCRNLIDAEQAAKNGFKYQGIGKKRNVEQCAK